ncbi:MAG: type II secretion system protein [Candidatus Nomurabacteria bacterium]|nr:type II secretion system protein [Candidatus Nomurabacteria bacterium]
MKKTINNTTGFTLLEIFFGVAAVGILAGIVIIAISPSKQLSETRNADRKVDVNTILNGVYQYSIDNSGVLPPSITTTSTEICASGAANCAGLIDLAVLTNLEKYLVAIPNEPQKTNANGAGYMIKKSANGRITVDAQFEEQGAVITITR